MLDTLRNFTDRLLGRGSAAITVPVMDGTLKPNRLLDTAEVVAELPGIDGLGLGGVGCQELWVSAGQMLYVLEGGRLVERRRFDAPVSAFAFSGGGQLVVALGGQRLQFHDQHGQLQDAQDQLDGQPLVAVNALAWEGEHAVVFSDGSLRHGPEDWCRDLMTLGHSGRVGRWTVASSKTELLASGLEHAFGVLPNGDGAGGVLVSESWRHRVQLCNKAAHGRPKSLVAELPGYPSRMAPAEDGGFWLTCFVCRTQLVEFVLREKAYRERMVADLEPKHWIAPALSSGNTFLEPLQGAGVKNMGVRKPWAPPRSYGLVMHVQADGRVSRSLHSQVDGRHHGVTAVAQQGHWLYVVTKGSGRLLKVDLRQDSAACVTTGAQS